MPDIARISPYLPHERLKTRPIAAAILLALLLHAVVLLFFYLRSSPPATIQPQTIDISFETSTPGAQPEPDKQPAPARALTTSSEIPADSPTQPALETPPQTTPVSAEPPVAAAESTSPPQEKIHSVSSLTRIPGPLKRIEATYPASERSAGIQAYVLTEVTIDAQGKVQDVRILKSAGNAFDNSVIDALKNSAFTPGYIGDKAVPVRLSIPFRFNLK